MMMQQKRCPVSFDQGSLRPKRHKTDLSAVSKKEKVGERINALQQLVSPYGKTDTASVLLEAMDYIRFLHDQVKVLSAPYFCSTETATAEVQDLEAYNNSSLRTKGLCLVPVSSTIGVTSNNGADIWAPIKTASQEY